MSIQRVHPRESLLAPLTSEGPIITMQLLVPLTIVLPREPLPAPRPLALERLLVVMAPQMALQVEAPREGAPAPRHGTDEVRVLLAAAVGRVGCSAGGDVGLRDEVRVLLLLLLVNCQWGELGGVEEGRGVVDVVGLRGEVGGEVAWGGVRGRVGRGGGSG